MAKPVETISKTLTDRAKSLAEIEAEVARCKADPEISFLFHTMSGLSSLRTIGTTSPIKQLMIGMAVLDHLFEEGYTQLAPTLIALGEVLGQALADIGEAEASPERTVSIDPTARKTN